MSQPGLSPELFIDRIERAGSVVQAWPFGYLEEPESYRRAHSPILLSYVSDNVSVVSIGRVDVRTGDEVRFFPKDTRGGYALDLCMSDEQETRAWQGMAGVNLAVRVVLGAEKDEAVPSRAARVTRILGVEQPISAPNSEGAYRNQAAARDQGFIQGEVLVDPIDALSYQPRFPSNYEMKLRLQAWRGKRRLAHIACKNAAVVASANQLYLERPLEGNDIRARVIRTHGSRGDYFILAERTIYVLHGQ